MRKQNTMTFVNLPVVPIFWHYPGTIKGYFKIGVVLRMGYDPT